MITTCLTFPQHKSLFCPPASEVSYIHRKIWRSAQSRRFLSLLRTLPVRDQWTMAGHTVTGCCPFHGGNEATFTIDFEHGFATCPVCGEHVTDLIGFFAALWRRPYLEALHALKQYAPALHQLSQKEVNALVAHHTLQQRKNMLFDANVAVLQEYIRSKPSRLSYLDAGFLLLTKGIGLSVGSLCCLPVTLLARPEDAWDYIPEDCRWLYTGFLSPIAGPDLEGSVLLPYNDTPGTISQFTVRPLRQGAKEEAEAMLHDQAFPRHCCRELIRQETILLEDPGKPAIGLFGLRHSYRLGGGMDDAVHVTRDELGALAVMDAQLAGDSAPKFPVVATGWHAEADLSALHELGVHTVNILPDAPGEYGEGTVLDILRAGMRGAAGPQETAFAYRIFEWPGTLRGGDLAAAVRDNDCDLVGEALCPYTSRHFQNLLPWVTDRFQRDAARAREAAAPRIAALEQERAAFMERHASEGSGQLSERDAQELRGLDVALDNAKDDLRLACLEAAAFWRAFLPPRDQVLFDQSCGSVLGEDLARQLAAGSPARDCGTAEGARAVLLEALSKRVTPAFCLTGGPGGSGATRHVFWSRVTHRLHRLPADAARWPQALGEMLGKPLPDWMRETLGEGSILEEGVRDPGTLAAERKMRGNAAQLMRGVLEKLTLACPPLGSLRTLDQGVFYKDMVSADPASRCAYVANGELLFRGTFPEDNCLPVTWERMDSCTDNGFLFMLDAGKRWCHVRDVRDLPSTASMDLSGLFGACRGLITQADAAASGPLLDIGAAMLLAAPVMRAITARDTPPEAMAFLRKHAGEGLQRELTVALLPSLPSLCAGAEALSRSVEEAFNGTMDEGCMAAVAAALAVYQHADPARHDPHDLLRRLSELQRLRHGGGLRLSDVFLAPHRATLPNHGKRLS